MRKTIKFTGEEKGEYDLDELTQDSRLNSEKGLRVQVYEFAEGENENPDNRHIGSIWLSLKKK